MPVFQPGRQKNMQPRMPAVQNHRKRNSNFRAMTIFMVYTEYMPAVSIFNVFKNECARIEFLGLLLFIFLLRLLFFRMNNVPRQKQKNADYEYYTDISPMHHFMSHIAPERKVKYSNLSNITAYFF